MELASKGELYKHLKNAPFGRFNEHRAAKYTYQVADALNYCHVNNVIHRDLKPENIMLTADDNVKLADFGWSAHTNSNKRKTMCGTLDYLPPEMVDGQSYDDSIDQWCLGILCYEFLVGRPPFEADGTEGTYANIRNLNVVYPKYLSFHARNLIAQVRVCGHFGIGGCPLNNVLTKMSKFQLLQKDHKSRLTLTGVMKHQWIAENLQNPGRDTVVLQ